MRYLIETLWYFIKRLVRIILAIVILAMLYQYVLLPRLPIIQAFAGNAVTNLSGKNQPSMDELAGYYGVAIDYNFDDIDQYCLPENDDSGTLAAFCDGSPDVIYVNQQADGWNRAKLIGGEDEVILHELAHRQIFQLCRTTDPPIIEQMGANSENTASSYAVQYLQADRITLRAVSYSFPGDDYAMNEASDRAAQAIHNGQCT